MESDEIICGKMKYSNKEDVDIMALWNLISEIKKIMKSDDQEDGIAEAGFSYNCFEAVGGIESPVLCMN